MAARNPHHMNGMARTYALMAGLTALFGGVGYVLGGAGGMTMALVFAAGTNLFAYWNSDKMVLRMHGAKEVGPRQAPQLYAMLENLARNADMPVPKLYIMQNHQPNAFATGRNPQHGVVAVTTGLLDALDHDEIEGVIAHELAHIQHRDSLIMTITATISGALSMLANMSLFMGGRRNHMGALGTIAVVVLAPVAAMIVQMTISRTREYAADRSGAEICGKPLALASALRKIDTMAARRDNMPAERAPATAHMFIINPLHKYRADHLFSTHPNTANRIARLQDMAASMVARAQNQATRARGPWG